MTIDPLSAAEHREVARRLRSDADAAVAGGSVSRSIGHWCGIADQHEAEADRLDVAAALDAYTAEGSVRYTLTQRPDGWTEITAASFVDDAQEYRCRRAVQAVETAGGVAVLTVAVRRLIPEGRTNEVERVIPAALARLRRD